MMKFTFTEPIQSDILIGYYTEYTISQDPYSPEFFVVTSQIMTAGRAVYGEPDAISVTKRALARMLREIERGENRASG